MRLKKLNRTFSRNRLSRLVFRKETHRKNSLFSNSYLSLGFNIFLLKIDQHSFYDLKKIFRRIDL